MVREQLAKYISGTTMCCIFASTSFSALNERGTSQAVLFLVILLTTITGLNNASLRLLQLPRVWMCLMTLRAIFLAVRLPPPFVEDVLWLPH
jgi:hypothetical protein